MILKCKYMEEEIWKDIPNYEGLYQVSDYGRIRSFIRSCRYGYDPNGRIIISKLNGNGYLRILLHSGGLRKIYSVHQLVAIAFLNHIPDRTHKIVVNHIDGNRTNNYLINLELVSQRCNITDGWTRRERTSKYVGVSLVKNRNIWRSTICVNNKKLHLGYYKSEIEASSAYQLKLSELL